MEERVLTQVSIICQLICFLEKENGYSGKDNTSHLESFGPKPREASPMLGISKCSGNYS